MNLIICMVKHPFIHIVSEYSGVGENKHGQLVEDN